MKKFIFALSVILLAFICIPRTKASSNDYDHIRRYEITVKTRDDATLDLTYDIVWDVLRNEDDGSGVDEVFIGVANKYVDEISPISNSVKKCRYSNSTGGSTIKCVLSKTYHAGETIHIQFKLHQKRIFTYNESTNLVTYEFRPGWFDKIMVDDMIVRWDASNIYYAATDVIDDNYLVFERKNVNYGGTISCPVSYELSNFPNVDLNKQYTEEAGIPAYLFVAIAMVALFVICVVISIIGNVVRSHNSYESYRGFYPNIVFYPTRSYYYGSDNSGVRFKPTASSIYSGGTGHSGGHSCACACACACAGGGRAGCSRKDFYKSNVEFIEK